MDNFNNPTSQFDTAIHSLWFGLNYGSILTAFALYKTLEQAGRKPVLIQKPTGLWTTHYADKSNISGLFVYKNAKVLEIFDDHPSMEIYKQINTHISGSDVIWNGELMHESIGFFMLADVPESSLRISVGSSFGGSMRQPAVNFNSYYKLLHRFDSILAADKANQNALREYFNIDSPTVLDPVFLCDKQAFVDPANGSEAKRSERSDKFIFASIEGGDARKKEFILQGNRVLLHNGGSPLRLMIDINRFPESRNAIDLEPAALIHVEDYLYYLINSEFVFTDNIYAMYLAVIFEKPFAALANIDDPDLYRFKEFLSMIGLDERLVILQDDFKYREYLFRKPVNYKKVNSRLGQLRADSMTLLHKALDPQ